MYAYTDACMVARFVVNEIQASYSGYILDSENIMCLCTTLTIPYQNLLFGCFKGASELDVSIQQPEHILRDGSGIYICDINRLFAYCEGGNFNIHIWVWFGSFICKEGKTGFIYNLVKS